MQKKKTKQKKNLVPASQIWTVGWTKQTPREIVIGIFITYFYTIFYKLNN